MEQKNKYIEDLLEKFFEGLTSLKEEQELYKFFSEQRNLPQELEQYRPLFQYFETEMNSELEQAFGKENDVIADATIQLKHNTLLNKKWIFVVSAVAASLLLLFVVNPFSESSDFNIYEGSYVRIDGVVSYDAAEIETERLRIEAFVEERLACLEEPFAEASEKAKLLQMDEEVEAKLTRLREPFVKARLQVVAIEKIEGLSQPLALQ